MESSHPPHSIGQEAGAEGGAFRVQLLVDRRIPNRDLLSGRREFGGDTIEFGDPPVPVPSIEHAADTENHRNQRHHAHHPPNREPHAKLAHGLGLDNTKLRDSIRERR
jgi:hypothetical protein